MAAARHVPGYIGASGYRVLLAGQETERNAYGLGQASKVYGTFPPGLLRQQGGREEGAGEKKPQEGQEEQQSCRI